jgi:hypothetical protein
MIQIVGRKTEGNGQLERPSRGWKDNIEMNPKWTELEGLG